MSVNAAEPEVLETNNEPTIVITKVSDDVLEDKSVSPRIGAYFVDLQEEIASGEVIQGTFTLTNWFGTDLTVIAGASNTGGSLGLGFVSAYYNIPCNGTANVIARETGWPRGTYSYYISNNTGNTTRVAFKVYEP